MHKPQTRLAEDRSHWGQDFLFTTTEEHYTRITLLSAFQKSIQETPARFSSLVCVHDGTIQTTIASTKITSFSAESVPGGLKAVYGGDALVKVNDAQFESGWSFTVTAIDLDVNGLDAIGVTLTDPSGQVHCMVEPTPLTSGSIIIRN